MGSLREFQWKLQEAKGFENPKIKFEQYVTSAEIAANMLWAMDTQYGDVEDRVVMDFGCGCGILGIAADLLGSRSVQLSSSFHFALREY
jgi:predicted RNA methylase